jgi:hypothetical protein
MLIQSNVWVECLTQSRQSDDQVTVTWCVVDRDGSIIESGFTSNASAWKWADTDNEADQIVAAMVDRIHDAFASR